MVPLGVEILNCPDALDVQVLTSHMDHTQDASILVLWVAYLGLNYVSFKPISSQSLKENIFFEGSIHQSSHIPEAFWRSMAVSSG